jgi:secondary thiamine-phosphate synthase enzyme
VISGAPVGRLTDRGAEDRMNKRSTITGRDAPMTDVSATSSGGLLIHGESLTVQTSERVELVDLTGRVADLVRRSGIREGMVSLWSMHTTCALLINEVQTALHSDIKAALERIVARDGNWLHNDPAHSDCDRMNADSHLRAMLLGHSLTLQIAGGELVLGQWQRILMGELDGPRARNIRAQAWGI